MLLLDHDHGVLAWLRSLDLGRQLYAELLHSVRLRQFKGWVRWTSDLRGNPLEHIGLCHSFRFDVPRLIPLLHALSVLHE